MISYFVHNLDSYSGALLLARHLNRKVFNHNNKEFKKYNDLIEIIDLPQNKFLQLFYIKV